jgi:glucokinase
LDLQNGSWMRGSIMTELALVGDIGGTNSRFGLEELG